MALVTLTNLVLKTVTAAGVKPATPADRIGQGTMAVVAFPASVPSAYPASDSEPGLRRGLASREAAAPAVPPAGPAGCAFAPGSPARRHGSRLDNTSLTGCWRAAKPAVAGSRLLTSRLPSGMFGAGLPGSVRLRVWLDGDCQSPDRRDSNRTNPQAATNRKAIPATRDTAPITAAAK